MDLIYRNYTELIDVVMDLQRFAEAGTNVNTTTQNVNAYTGEHRATTAASDMSASMKRYYDTELLENARNEHYYAQFGRKQNLPRGRGKIIEWRKFNTLPNAERLTEGVIPTGKDFGMTVMTSDIKQYGMYITVSDQLELHAIDNIILGATEELGASAGETQDMAIRNVLMEGTNVMYAQPVDENGNPTGEAPVGRWGLTKANRLTPDTVNRAATLLKKLKAPRINGKYIALIHPSVTYDLRNSEYWIEAHKYARPEEIYNGEIGELHGVRFIETSNAPVWSGAPLNGEAGRTLTLTTTYVNNDNTGYAEWGDATAFKATITETPTKELVGRYVHIYDASESAFTGTVKIVGVDTANKHLWFDIDLGITPAAGDKLYPGESGAEEDGESTAVYGCLFLGKDAYGIIDPDGAAMEMIIHDKDEAGGPLNQFSTVGYKFSGGAKILYEDRMLRVECCSEFSGTDEDNSNPIKQATPYLMG